MSALHKFETLGYTVMYHASTEEISFLDLAERANCDALRREAIRLNKGDILMFRGDFIYPTVGYSSPNVCLHAYLGVPGYERDEFTNHSWCHTVTMIIVSRTTIASASLGAAMLYQDAKFFSAAGPLHFKHSKNQCYPNDNANRALWLAYSYRFVKVKPT
ncbi:hypothetical protein GQ600_26444 [Phytophthora cactorum]|nr:hypothetical protein GQ600_26444 [Phytophthora cactorum]